jgi:hypothetical protein
MNGLTRFLIVVASVVVLQACSCSGTAKTEGGPCDGPDAPAGCGIDCSTAGGGTCPAGLYCSGAGECRADCAGGAENRCPVGQYCTADGRCLALPGGDGSAGDSDPYVCADVVVEAARVTPTVMLIIDQSSSMTASFSGGSRWNVLKNFLLDDPDGLIASLDDQVEFGLALYSAESEDGGSGGPPIGECPRLTQVAPGPNNYAAIETVYRPANVIEDTPTGDAIEAILDSLLSIPDPDPDPTIFIVATDGEPDTCRELDPQNGQPEAIAAVERAFDSGIRTFMISVGEGTVSASHMQDMANAGLGMRGRGSAEYWEAGDDATLRRALEDIVGGVLSCDISLNGTIENIDEACTGTVRLNGRDLACDDPDGWEATSPNTIRLNGAACDELTMTRGAILEATFPCDIVII